MHAPLATDRTRTSARGHALLIIVRQPGMWRVRQILDDPAGGREWGIDVDVDSTARRARRMVEVGRLD